ncbi:MAG: CoB--CoM heterodisulfide reductase iron-sulfur subunit B family protein [Caldilineales bacterium]|nr:CoB--CoM heterodisulfide reductase iron-sulfur subunit B family protein [Caldilineales bacterium]MCW5858712.1 CoB--CoM heterodisulfide reductase iron-sulfur subunit B family protein [Caldilineales bacterium]
MKYGFYPGCSLERNAIAYHQSTMAVAQELGIEFVEVDDWNCCGATEYIAIDLLPAYALISRNLALASQLKLNGGSQKQLVAPCSACYLNLTKADKYMADAPLLAQQVNTALQAGGLSYTPGSVRVRHLLDIVINDVGYAAVAKKVTKPLYALRVAPYYGCLIVRPGFREVLDDPEYPTVLDKLMTALGATVVDFPVKTHCCGGHMTQISEPTALELIRRLLKNATDYNADVIVTLCPMCQLNLDGYQELVNQHFGTDYHIPILYFTQLMGLAFGLPARALGFGKEIVPANPALAKIGAEPPPKLKKERPSREALPMPVMPEEE